MLKVKKSKKYRKPIFRKVDYKEYYNYLDNIDYDNVKAMVNYYDVKGQTFITGIISAIIVSAILGMYGLIYERLKEIYSVESNISFENAQILANGLIMTSIVITLILIAITVIICKNYRNKRYEINIAKEYIANKEKENGKS